MAQYQSILTGPEIDAALQDMAAHNSEAWAVGQRNGADVTSLDVTYHNNARYYANAALEAANRAESAVPVGTAGVVFFDRAQTLTGEIVEGSTGTTITGQKGQFFANLGLGALATFGYTKIS